MLALGATAPHTCEVELGPVLTEIPSEWMLPCTERGTLRVLGPDRVSWLNGLLTGDVRQAAPGRAVWALLLNRLGKIQSEIWVLAAEDSLLLSVSPGTVGVVQQELDQRLIMEDAELREETGRWQWYLGHSARGAELCGPGVSTCAELDVLGAGGGVVFALEAGSAPPAVHELSQQEWTLLRARAGLGEFGVDYTAQDRPHEAALDRRAVAWNKGCYLGQEVVCMQDLRGKVKHAVRPLRIAAAASESPLGKQLLNAQGQPVGAVTSAQYDPDSGVWRALSRVTLEALDSLVLAESSAPVSAGS